MDKLITPYKVGFNYIFECIGRDGKVKWVEKLFNLIPDVGLDYIVNAAMTGGAQFSTWYLGISETAYAPVAGETATTIMTNAPECKKYTAGARVTIAPDAVASALWANTSTPAEITFNASASVKVGFLSTVNTWDSTSGLLISAVQFPTPRVITESGEILKVTVGIQLVAA